MDPKIGWYQPEQFGPAKDLWLHIWEAEIAEKRLDILTLKNDNSPNTMGNKVQQDYISLDPVTSRVGDDRLASRVQHNTCNNYYNPSRRKGDNRASTYGMNYNYDALVGEYGGCPWRQPNKHYSKGVLGYVKYPRTVIPLSHRYSPSHQYHNRFNDIPYVGFAS